MLPRYKPLRRSGFLRRARIVSKHTYTGPSARVRMLVRLRAGHTCEWPVCGRVGTAYHHRRPRRMGGSRDPQTNQPSNLLFLCREHHEWIESNRQEAHRLGLLLHQDEAPPLAPVTSRHGVVLLDDEGGWTEAL